MCIQMSRYGLKISLLKLERVICCYHHKEDPMRAIRYFAFNDKTSYNLSTFIYIRITRQHIRTLH
jgi:hypothetical protein